MLSLLQDTITSTNKNLCIFDITSVARGLLKTTGATPAVGRCEIYEVKNALKYQFSTVHRLLLRKL